MRRYTAVGGTILAIAFLVWAESSAQACHRHRRCRGSSGCGGCQTASYDCGGCTTTTGGVYEEPAYDAPPAPNAPRPNSNIPAAPAAEAPRPSAAVTPPSATLASTTASNVSTVWRPSLRRGWRR